MYKLSRFLQKQAAQMVLPGASALAAADLEDGSTDDKLISALATASGAGIADATAQRIMLEDIKPNMEKFVNAGEEVGDWVGKQVDRAAKKKHPKLKFFKKLLTTPISGDNFKDLLKPRAGAPGYNRGLSLLATLVMGGAGAGVGFLAGKGINELKDKF